MGIKVKRYTTNYNIIKSTLIFYCFYKQNNVENHIKSNGYNQNAAVATRRGRSASSRRRADASATRLFLLFCRSTLLRSLAYVRSSFLFSLLQRLQVNNSPNLIPRFSFAVGGICARLCCSLVGVWAII